MELVPFIRHCLIYLPSAHAPGTGSLPPFCALQHANLQPIGTKKRLL